MKIRDLSKHTKSTIYRVASSILLCVALCLCLMMISTDTLYVSDTDKVVYSFALSLYVLAIFELATYLFKHEVLPSRFDNAHFAFAILQVAAASLAVAMVRRPTMLAIAGFLYMLVPIARRVTSIIRTHTKRNVVKQSIIIALLVLYALALLVFAYPELEFAFFLCSYMIMAAIVLNCIINVCKMALSNFNYEILRKIIRKTYAGEIIFGLLLLIVAFSLVFVRTEPGITSFADAVWYCFAVVTTIGFGDFSASSILGRVLTVLLGVYGLIVVAIVTSIIVNFYNEIKNKDDEEDEPIEELGLAKEEPSDEQPHEEQESALAQAEPSEMPEEKADLPEEQSDLPEDEPTKE